MVGVETKKKREESILFYIYNMMDVRRKWGVVESVVPAGIII
jgi:hypothetical protein